MTSESAFRAAEGALCVRIAPTPHQQVLCVDLPKVRHQIDLMSVHENRTQALPRTPVPADSAIRSRRDPALSMSPAVEEELVQSIEVNRLQHGVESSTRTRLRSNPATFAATLTSWSNRRGRPEARARFGNPTRTVG